jgi:hypothetical protein
MSIQQTLQKEIEESKRWLDVEKDDSTFKRDLQKRIELILVINVIQNENGTKYCK